MNQKIKTVCVTGGAGYVGSVLVPHLLDQGYEVRVLDLFIFGRGSLELIKNHPKIKIVKGDIRDRECVHEATNHCDAVIHLACISNDPSFELDPELGKSINYDAFLPLVQISKKNQVKRFIYASSSSVYGVKEEDQVNEELSLEPLTDYSKYKALCENLLHDEKEDHFMTLVLRPATVCGYSPRLRLDLTVNILTNHAYHNHEIKVFGGSQQRPNIHIQDMAAAYLNALKWDDHQIQGKTFNVGYENYSIMEIAKMVQNQVDHPTSIKQIPTNDLRSYRISSQKIFKELGFKPRHSLQDAIQELIQAFKQNKVPDSFTDSRYFNVKEFQSWRSL